MKLARIIRLDGSDVEIFDTAAEPGEWAIPGTFAFSNWTEDDLSGQNKQAFTHGWLGLTSFARGTVVAVTTLTETERDQLIESLAFHFTESWGAPNMDAARPVAAEEITQMITLCEDHPENTLIIVERSLTDAGVRDKFRLVPPQGASLETFAVHGD